MNNWDFSVEFVRDVYHALSQAGVDYMEIGYKNSPKLLKTPNAGPWAFLEEDMIRHAVPNKTATKLSAVVDIGRVDETDILPKSESMLDLIRVACYVADVPKAIDLVERFHALGYETSVNIMALSHVKEADLNDALDMLVDCSADMVYVVDSFGNLVASDVEYYVQRYRERLPEKHIGIHTHNNLQMAFSNTLTAMNHGAAYLDSSLFGMGRGAGNCPTELLVGSIRSSRYDLRPILEVLERRMIPLRETVEWGYTIPYMLTGLLNEHPRTAIALRSSDDKDKYLEYYDQLTSVETHSRHL